MNRFAVSCLLGVAACFAATESADAGHRVYYYSGPAYYAAPAYYAPAPVYYAAPVYVAPAPVVVHRPMFAPTFVRPAPVYTYYRPTVVSYPAYYGVPAYRPYRELEIKYRWTRRGWRVKYDFD